MKTPVARPVRRLAPVLLGLLALTSAAGARAQGVSGGAHCTLRGVSQLPTNTPIYAADGKPIARFSGSESALSANAPDAQGRAAVETGTGNGSFRIKGQVEASKI